MSRSTRATIAADTVEAARRGWYDGPVGRVDLSPLIDPCLAGTSYYPPDDLERLRLGPTSPEFETAIDVRNETTLEGIARLHGEGAGPVAALNFASAKNPGGGFLGGSQAQEESLARSSALYPSLCRARPYYDLHRASGSCLYTDAMIVSPDCPIFRDDAGRWLDTPRLATFITSAAPNAGAVKTRERHLLAPTLRRRAGLVLSLAAHLGYSALVLGAWGCGVFRNDPTMVAEAFASLLRGDFAARFRRIAFSVLDGSAGAATLKAFEDALG
jgi:uncharacterized protein (TIGR02452 family)